MSTIAQSLELAAARLPDTELARLDAELLLARALGQDRSYLYTWPERQLDDEALTRFGELLARRMSGEPVAYILGERGFWTLDLKVSADTLIPRPETELLVEAALARLGGLGARVVDLGTGSGAIALAIASECPACEVIAVERSETALAVAQDNAARNEVNNVTFVCGSWFEPLAGQHFDLIVSNPPYIRAADPHLQQGDVRFEPLTALASGEDGLDAIRHIVATAGAHLHPGGWLLLEHGYDQGEAVRGLLQRAGFVQTQTLRDLQRHERVSMGCFVRT